MATITLHENPTVEEMNTAFCVLVNWALQHRIPVIGKRHVEDCYGEICDDWEDVYSDDEAMKYISFGDPDEW